MIGRQQTANRRLRIFPSPLLFVVCCLLSTIPAQVSAQQLPVPVWDVNQDSIVDMLDLLIVVANFGKEKPQQGDVDGNGVVDIFDLVIVARHFGEITKRPELPKGLPPPPGLP